MLLKHKEIENVFATMFSGGIIQIWCDLVVNIQGAGHFPFTLDLVNMNIVYNNERTMQKCGSLMCK